MLQHTHYTIPYREKKPSVPDMIKQLWKIGHFKSTPQSPKRKKKLVDAATPPRSPSTQSKVFSNYIAN